MAAKGYSPTRRWLRVERAREHAALLASGHYSDAIVRVARSLGGHEMLVVGSTRFMGVMRWDGDFWDHPNR